MTCILSSVSLLAIFPLKILCNLRDIPFLVSLILSGFIACFNIKFYSLLTNKNLNIVNVTLLYFQGLYYRRKKFS